MHLTKEAEKLLDALRATSVAPAHQMLLATVGLYETKIVCLTLCTLVLTLRGVPVCRRVVQHGCKS